MTVALGFMRGGTGVSAYTGEGKEEKIHTWFHRESQRASANANLF